MKAKLNPTKSAGLLSLLFALMAFVALGEVHAQSSGEVTGQVTEARTGEPLPGVNVLIVETEQGAATNAQGQYTITGVEPGTYTLQASFVGYTAQTEEEVEVRQGGTTTVDFEMEESLGELEELVVVGYGRQEQESLTGSVETVSAASIEDRPITNSSQALQGTKGIYVNQASGQPGKDDATLRIRGGMGTLGSSDPLVLVDGIEGSLRNINPVDIESVTVLKDAAAAAIYGNRAADGVVLISTKTGRRGEGIQADYNFYAGWQDATFLPETVDALTYMEVRNQASMNEGVALAYTEEEVEEYRNGVGNNPDLYPDNDWFDIMFDRALMQEHNMRLHGGSEQAAYSFSLGYLNQDGIMMGTGAEKYSLRSNVQYDVTDRLTFGGRFSATYWDRHEPAPTADLQMDRIDRALPIHPNILSDGRYGDTWLTTPGHNVFRHPVALNTEGYLEDESLGLLGNLTAEYSLPFDIDYNLNLAVNKVDGMQSRFEPDVYYYNPKTNERRRILFDDRNSFREVDNELNTTFYNTVSWNGDIVERNRLDIIIGFSREAFSNEVVTARREGFFGNDLHDLNAGSTNDYARSFSSESALLSYFGRTHYSFSDKYLLEFSFRYDGSSRFAEGHRWGFFPSFSAGWRMSEEGFMQKLEFVNELKLRGSWGQLGDQDIPLFAYASRVNLDEQHVFNDNMVSAASVNTLADRSITWETTTISNIGLDLEMFEGRLDLTLDYFDKKTEDILTQISVPAQVGNLAGPIVNLYDMTNKGVEVGVGFEDAISTDIDYRLGANVSVVENNVDFLDGDVHLHNNTEWGRMNIIQEGYPVDSYYLLDAIGIFRSQEEVDSYINENGNPLQPGAVPGDIKYRDVNGDGVVNTDDRIVTGRSMPKYTFSLNMGFNFKGLDVSALFQGVQGVDTYPRHNLAYPVMNGAGLIPEHLDFWSPENTDAAYPRIGLPKRGSQVNYRLSTFWLQDASYLRFKNLQIGYTIPSEIFNLRRLRIYANAQNLLTLSNYTLTDPERNTLQGTINTFPSTRIITVGVNLGI